MWPVEIYSKEFLDIHPLAQLRLQYNADSTKYKSSFGDDMVVIYKAWSTTSEQAKQEFLSSKRKFANFLNRLLPSNTALVSWLPLLKNASWSYWMQRFVSHPWGRHTLVASQVTVVWHLRATTLARPSACSTTSPSGSNGVSGVFTNLWTQKTWIF